ncbi:MAG: enoyl-CoA hydratase-related protein [Aeromicrobium sp.]
MTTSQVSAEVADRVMTVTLDRPDRLNALTVDALHELVAALDRADADDDVRAVVVTGRGRAFCAGADLSAGDDAFDPSRVTGGEVAAGDVGRDGGGMLALRIFASTKPVIGAINGPAVGGGASMTLPMDVRLASTTATYTFPYVQRGIVPEGCASWFLPRVVGIATAQEWVLTGRRVTADEALARGLVSSLHEPDDLLPAAYGLAADITRRTSPVSVAMSRQMLWRMLDAPHPVLAHEVESRALSSRGAAADVREGVGSFLERRPPVFTDRVSDDMPDDYPWWTDPPFTPRRTP